MVSVVGWLTLRPDLEGAAGVPGGDAGAAQ
jgi:hypothetical protein